MTQPPERLITDLARGGLTRASAPEIWDALHGPAAAVFPETADLPYRPLAVVHEYWKSMTRIDGVAQQLRIEPERIVGALGYVMLVDALEGGEGFRYALYGSRIASVAGFDMTGRLVSEVPAALPTRLFFVACYTAVQRHHVPIYTVHQAPDDILIGGWHRLMLPLGEGTEVRRLLVCNVPVDPHGRPK